MRIILTRKKKDKHDFNSKLEAMSTLTAFHFKTESDRYWNKNIKIYDSDVHKTAVLYYARK